MVVPEFVLGLVFSGFFFSIAALQIADYNHPSLIMIIDAQDMIGRFYKFIPRSQWPESRRKSIPVDDMYESHPVIVVSVTNVGALNTVMVTSHPVKPISNYVPIGFQSDRVPVRPLELSKALPKQTWVQLNSVRTYPKELFIPFENVSLGKRSKKRLIELVNQPEIHQNQQALARKPTPATPKLKPTNLFVQPAPAPGIELNHSDIQEIKTSLTELARAVTALAAVCNKLEADAALSPRAAQLPTKTVTETSCMPTEMSVAVSVEVANHSEVVTLKGAALVQSKRSRLGKWLAAVFKVKKTIASRDDAIGRVKNE